MRSFYWRLIEAHFSVLKFPHSDPIRFRQIQRWLGSVLWDRFLKRGVPPDSTEVLTHRTLNAIMTQIHFKCVKPDDFCDWCLDFADTEYARWDRSYGDSQDNAENPGHAKEPDDERVRSGEDPPGRISQAIEIAFGFLTGPDQVVLSLALVDRLPDEEIAAKLDVSIAEVGVLIDAARGRFQQFLEADPDIPPDVCRELLDRSSSSSDSDAT